MTAVMFCYSNYWKSSNGLGGVGKVEVGIGVHGHGGATGVRLMSIMIVLS